MERCEWRAAKCIMSCPVTSESTYLLPYIPNLWTVILSRPLVFVVNIHAIIYRSLGIFPVSYLLSLHAVYFAIISVFSLINYLQYAYDVLAKLLGFREWTDIWSWNLPFVHERVNWWHAVEIREFPFEPHCNVVLPKSKIEPEMLDDVSLFSHVMIGDGLRGESGIIMWLLNCAYNEISA